MFASVSGFAQYECKNRTVLAEYNTKKVSLNDQIGVYILIKHMKKGVEYYFDTLNYIPNETFLLTWTFEIFMILSDNDFRCLYSHSNVCQKQPSRGVLKKRCPENMQQIYRRKLKPKCDFKKVVLHGYGCSPVNLLYIFRTPFPRNTPLDGCFWSATIIRISISMKH